MWSWSFLHGRIHGRLAHADSRSAEETVKDAQAKTQAQLDARLKELDEQQKAAKTEEEKKTIQQQKVPRSPHPKFKQMDFGPIDNMMKNPTIKIHAGLYGSAAILSLILLISGIGLIRLTPWGRSMAVAWAVMQIVQLVSLPADRRLSSVPSRWWKRRRCSPRWRPTSRPARPPRAGRGHPDLESDATPVSPTSVVMWTIGGSIYPVVVLILLNPAAPEPPARRESRSFAETKGHLARSDRGRGR